MYFCLQVLASCSNLSFNEFKFEFRQIKFNWLKDQLFSSLTTELNSLEMSVQIINGQVCLYRELIDNFFRLYSKD